jgi:hypothetical protein
MPSSQIKILPPSSWMSCVGSEIVFVAEGTYIFQSIKYRQIFLELWYLPARLHAVQSRRHAV